MAHFPKPAEGSWTEHYPELGTAPVSYEDSISPSSTSSSARRSSSETWLNVGRVEQLPRNGSYFTKELDGRQHVGRSWSQGTRRRGPRLPQHLPPPRQQAGVERLPRRGDRAAPAGSSPASTTAGATTSTATSPSCSRRRSSSTSTRTPTAWCRCSCEVWEGFIFVNLDPDDTDVAAGVPRPTRRRPRGLPVRRDDPGATRTAPRSGSNWKLFIDAFAEFYHAPVLHAKQAADRGVPQAPGLRLRGAGLRHRRSARAWCRPGAACRRRRT